MDVRANPGAHRAHLDWTYGRITGAFRARMDVRANSGAFYAPFLFAPTIAALRPHHIGRIPPHSVRANPGAHRAHLDWTYGRIPAHSMRAWTYGRIVAHSMRHFYSPIRLPRYDRITSGESRRIPCGRIPAHSMRTWTYGRIPAHDVRHFYSPLRLPGHDRIGRFPHAFVIDTRCRGTLGTNQQYA
jgi:hypothetical protein